MFQMLVSLGHRLASKTFREHLDPNKAKSYFAGSFLSIFSDTPWALRLPASRSVSGPVSESVWLPWPHAHQSGISAVPGWIGSRCQNQPLVVFRTIQRRYMFKRLQVEPLAGLEMCFLVRSGASSSEKKYLWNWTRASYTDTGGWPPIKKAVWWHRIAGTVSGNSIQ